MRIYFSPDSDPMILDSLSGHNAIYSELSSFLSSNEEHIVLQADTSGSSEPYSILLEGLAINKNKNPVLVTVENNQLCISGSKDNLNTYISHFRFSNNEEGCHHHPEYTNKANYLSLESLSVIIEADSEYINALKRS